MVLISGVGYRNEEVQCSEVFQYFQEKPGIQFYVKISIFKKC